MNKFLSLREIDTRVWTEFYGQEVKEDTRIPTFSKTLPAAWKVMEILITRYPDARLFRYKGDRTWQVRLTVKGVPIVRVAHKPAEAICLAALASLEV